MKRFNLNPLILSTLIALLTVLPAQAKTTLKLATVTPDHHAYTKGAQEFARLVEEATNAEIVIKVFGGGRLGKGERELLEGMQLGTIDLAVTATGPVSNFSEDMGVVDLPFLFTSNEHVDKVLDGPIGRGLLDGIEKANF
jgi:TRAP-type C4-dicarboxylate transport system substrate-binding protein